MPQKPKQEKQTIMVVVDNTPTTVTLYPPTGSRKSWYAYWNGLEASKSTGHNKVENAMVTAETMIRSWKAGGDGQRPKLSNAIMTDMEFEQIQQAYYLRKTDQTARARAEKTVLVCLDAIRAFKTITGLERLAFATPDDCARFQREALKQPKNWRQQYPRGRKPDEVERLSPNTVLKWSRSLQAAYERANRNAGKKCVRGVVHELKLLDSNPWNQFDWIEGRAKPIRQLDAEEIHSLLNYFEARWSDVTVAPLVAKVFLWSACRQTEITGLEWSSLRKSEGEAHFRVVGKMGVERWFRIPLSLYEQLKAVSIDSPFVFAAYNEQLRKFHNRTSRPDNARRVGEEFDPKCLGNWFADRMDDWSATLPNGHAHVHVLRKTTLQYARSGEDVNRQVAADVGVGESVMLTNYVTETDEQFRQASNRTFARIVASLPPDLAKRCGYIEKPATSLKDQLRKAIDAEDWPLVSKLTAMLARKKELAEK